jgi:CubicO group peptidase (beta-lactamase class C family)
VARLKSPGLAIGVVHNGRPVYSKGFGVARLGDRNPITTTSLFHMASITKVFVATAVAQLVERGAVHLDRPVATYLPYFGVTDDAGRTITVRQMLNHTSGMPDIAGAAGYNWDTPEYDEGALERYVRSVRDLALIAPPGTRYRYSNIAFEVLGDLIAKVSGMTFEQYVARHVLNPIGMTNSTLMLPEARKELVVTPHVRSNTGVISASSVFPYNRAHGPSSTLLSNVDDMMRFAIVNLKRGETDHGRVLAPASFDALWRPTATVFDGMGLPSSVGIGMAWNIREYGGQRFVAHGGTDLGFSSFLLLAPDAGAGVVALSNLDFARSELGQLAVTVLQTVIGMDLTSDQLLRP